MKKVNRRNFLGKVVGGALGVSLLSTTGSGKEKSNGSFKMSLLQKTPTLATKDLGVAYSPYVPLFVTPTLKDLYSSRHYMGPHNPYLLKYINISNRYLKKDGKRLLTAEEANAILNHLQKIADLQA